MQKVVRIIKNIINNCYLCQLSPKIYLRTFVERQSVFEDFNSSLIGVSNITHQNAIKFLEQPLVQNASSFPSFTSTIRNRR